MMEGNVMRLYLDNCCFNRPFDIQTQLKIYLETQAKLAVQKHDIQWSALSCVVIYA